MDIKFQPLDKWPRPQMTKRRKYGPFTKATPGKAQSLVRAEAERMGAKAVMLLAACTRKSINTFGELYSDARLEHPGIVVVCDMGPGKPPRRFACDLYDAWAKNMQAIGLTMERLRLVNAHGVIQADEQYRGFEALPPGPSAMPEWASPEDAARFLLQVEGFPNADADEVAAVVTDPTGTWKGAAKKAHPDAGGTEPLMAKVNRAKAFIEQHQGVAA